jgi:hypothetical protein
VLVGSIDVRFQQSMMSISLYQCVLLSVLCCGNVLVGYLSSPARPECVPDHPTRSHPHPPTTHINKHTERRGQEGAEAGCLESSPSVSLLTQPPQRCLMLQYNNSEWHGSVWLTWCEGPGGSEEGVSLSQCVIMTCCGAAW